MPMLVFTGDDAAQFQLRQGLNRLGRNPDNDWQIEDDSVSGAHCEVDVQGDAILIRDLGSTNGTFIDNRRIREAYMHEGQTLRLGSCAFCYVADTPQVTSKIRLSAPPPAEPPKAPALPANLRLPPIATGVKACAHHPNIAAAYVCKKCKGNFCASCVNEHTVSHRKLHFCRACGEDCVSLREPPKPIKRTENFFELLPQAFAYPFRRDGLILLVTGTVFFGFLDAITHAPATGPFVVFAYVLIVQLFALGYFISYMKAIVATSAYGDQEMPKWPDFANFWDDMMQPILLVAGSLLLCFAPVLIYMYYVDYTLPGLELAGFIGLIALGCIALPMCLLSVFLHDTIFALNPLVLIVSAFRVPAEYAIACIVFMMLVGLRVLTAHLAELSHIIPILPQVLDEFVSLYLACVEMRILGVLFFTKHKQLRWGIS